MSTDRAGINTPKLRNLKLTDAICDHIEKAIAEGALRPGDKIPSERDLAEAFGVSRATVAKAIAQLEMKGLVTSRQGGGTFVAQSGYQAFRNLFGSIVLLNRKTAEELLEVRRILEREIAALAAERATPDDIVNLNACVDEMQRTTQDATRFVDADLRFHLHLAKAAGNQLLYEMIRPIQSFVRHQMELGTPQPGAMERAIYWHKEIVDAVAAKDRARATDAIMKHLSDAQEEVAAATLDGTAPESPAPDDPAEKSPAGGKVS